MPRLSKILFEAKPFAMESSSFSFSFYQFKEFQGNEALSNVVLNGERVSMLDQHRVIIQVSFKQISSNTKYILINY